MKGQKRLKRWFKLRFAILYPFGTFIVLFSNSDDRALRQGIWFIIAGLLIRIWANGYAIKSEKLTTCGPYAFLRHPLYLGTILLIVGFIISRRLYWPGGLFLFIMAGTYYRTIKQEERMLEDKFKSRYIDYKMKIPAIFPSLFPYLKGEKWKFSLRRLIQSQEYKLFIWVIIMVIAFHLKDEFLVENEKIDAKIITLLAVAFFLGALDLTGEFFRHRKIKN